MKLAIESVRAQGMLCEPAICYTGDILDPKRDKYPLAYYVKMAKELERMGAHVLAIKDMAGLCRPYAAEKLIKEMCIRDSDYQHDSDGSHQHPEHLADVAD